jgi:hypothetical protein
MSPSGGESDGCIQQYPPGGTPDFDSRRRRIMRHARRFTATLIATLIGVATWCVASSTTAYALRDPGPADNFPVSQPPSGTIVTDTPLWKFVLVAAIAAMLTVAVVGLIASVRQARPSRPSGALHA